LYPQFYRKEEVQVTDEKGKKQAAFIYTVDYPGVQIIMGERVVNDLEQVIKNARKYHLEAKNRFHRMFRE